MYNMFAFLKKRLAEMLDLCLFVYSAADNGNSASQVKLTIGYSADENRLFIIVHSCRFYTILRTFYQISPSELLVAEKKWDLCTSAEPWQPAPRTVPTRTFLSSCCLTRRPQPRDELPPRRGTSTQSSMRGETNGKK